MRGAGGDVLRDARTAIESLAKSTGKHLHYLWMSYQCIIAEAPGLMLTLHSAHEELCDAIHGQNVQDHARARTCRRRPSSCHLPGTYISLLVPNHIVSNACWMLLLIAPETPCTGSLPLRREAREFGGGRPPRIPRGSQYLLRTRTRDAWTPLPLSPALKPDGTRFPVGIGKGSISSVQFIPWIHSRSNLVRSASGHDKQNLDTSFMSLGTRNR